MKFAQWIATMAAAGCFAAAGAASGQARAPDLEEAARSISALTGELRRQNGLQALEVNRILADTARYFADTMARAGKLDHEADGRDVAARVEERGYAYCVISENIASEHQSGNFSTAALAHSLVARWRKSPEHRENMLDPDVTETAAAVARSGNGYYYAVQVFGRPSTARLRFQIRNSTQSPVRYKIGQTTAILAPRQVRTHQQCRLQQLTGDWPGPPQDTTVRPGDGDRLSIARSASGALVLRKD